MRCQSPAYGGLSQCSNTARYDGVCGLHRDVAVRRRRALSAAHAAAFARDAEAVRRRNEAWPAIEEYLRARAVMDPAAAELVRRIG